MRYVLAGMLLIAAVGGGAAQGVMWVYGSGFGKAAPALAILLAVPALAALSSVQAHFLIAEGRPALSSGAALAQSALTVVLTIPLTLAAGISGAAAAVVAGFLLSIFIQGVGMRSYLTASLRSLWPRRQIVALALAYATGFATAYPVDAALRQPFGLLAALPAGSAVYLITLVASGGLDPRDRRRVGELIRRIRHRRSQRLHPPANRDSSAS